MAQPPNQFVALAPVMELICKHFQTCMDLHRLLLTNKALHALLSQSDQGRRIWFDLALRIRGVAKHQVSFSAQSPRLKEQIQTLLCTWLVVPRPLNVVLPSIAENSNLCETQIVPVSSRRLMLQVKLTDPSDASTQIRLYSVPSLPRGDGSMRHEARLDVNSPLDLLNEELPVFKHKLEERASLKRRLQGAMYHDIRMDGSRFCFGSPHTLRLVYGRVFALMHSIEKHVDDTSLSTARDLMVSFFCFDEAWRDVRFLRTICCGTTTALDEVDLCVRPSEMWVLEADRILYFGPYREPAALICDDRRMDGGRMNTVFWLLMHGFQHSAVHYLTQTLRLPIHQKSIYWDQNIMFFALMWKRISPVLRDSLLREREVFYQTILQNLVLQGLDPNEHDDRQCTPLMMACSMMDSKSVETLLELGADPNAVCRKGQNALFYIGRHRQNSAESVSTEKILNVLLQHGGVNVHQKDVEGRVPLFMPMLLNNAKAVRMLCEEGHADPRATNPMNGYTALHYLMEYNHYGKRQVLDLLVREYKVDVNARAHLGITPLMIATHKRNFKNVEMLIGIFQADKNLQDANGKTAKWYLSEVHSARPPFAS